MSGRCWSPRGDRAFGHDPACCYFRYCMVSHPLADYFVVKGPMSMDVEPELARKSSGVV
jgi:hypothetical protein